MKKILPFATLLASLLAVSCGGRNAEQQKAYTDSLMHIISCSPTIVDGPYTLEDQLNACDLLIKEYPEKKERLEEIKATIKKQMQNRNMEIDY